MKSIEEQLSQTHDRRVVIEKLDELAPDFVEMISKFCLEGVYSRPVLSEHMKEVVAIVALVSLGSDRLHGHFESALEAGMTQSELTEVIMLSSIYLGFPRAIDAMLVLHRLINKAA